ncbi:UDP-glucose dehydrogenase family protein [Taklimakanibacter lacteus]|uniref:UDP-glucose dehydrogenase family protein n=1 Tax=Taklimakanibacter lacteus TaxID=2268456 RepID=UPI000E66CC44
MNITMIGSSYVGLVSGACLADFGHRVTCVDKDKAKIDALRGGRIPIFEPGLDQVVADNVKAGRLSFTTDLRDGVAAADVVFLAVGTPSRRGDGHADLSFVEAAARELAGAVKPGTVIVIKSTVPVGTSDKVEHIMRTADPRLDISVASNPEFLREGSAIADFKRPDRIIVGVNDERGRNALSEVYRPLYLNRAPLLFTSRRTAELTKYAANAFLAMKVTFINEIADLCEHAGADVQDVARGIGLDNRIGSKFLHAGPGYGGSCFPKDTTALIRIAQDFASPLRLVETTVAINENRRRAMGRKIATACGGDLAGKTVALLGVTFKPNTDDIREAPALAIIQALQDGGAHVRLYDPAGMDAARATIEGVEFGGSAYEVAEGADALVIVTEWEEFRALDFRMLGQIMRSPSLVDLRNVYRREDIARHGFRYFSIGRPDHDIPLHLVEAAE